MLDFGDLLLIKMKNAAKSGSGMVTLGQTDAVTRLRGKSDIKPSALMKPKTMSQRDYLEWQSSKRVEAEYEKTGENQYRITNLDKVATPLNERQLDDVKANLRVGYEQSFQADLDKRMAAKEPNAYDNVYKKGISPMDERHELVMSVVKTGWYSGEYALDSDVAKEETFKATQSLDELTRNANQQSYFVWGGKGAVFPPSWTEEERMTYLANRNEWTDTSGNTTVPPDRTINLGKGESVTIPRVAKEPYYRDYGVESFKQISPEQELQIRQAIDMREEQVKILSEEVKDEIRQDTVSRELHLNARHKLVNTRWGEKSAEEAQAKGMLGQRDGHISGISQAGAYLPRGRNLPEGTGGQGECCVFNYYGGGGCGLCNRGASMSALRLTYSII